MTVYITTWTDPDDGGWVETFHTTKGLAEAQRKRIKALGLTIQAPTRIEVPDTKADFVHWLNARFSMAPKELIPPHADR